jgi:hypothetical protein
MLWGEAAGEPMSIDAEEAAIRTVILGALNGADARPNWQAQPARETLTGVQWR